MKGFYHISLRRFFLLLVFSTYPVCGQELLNNFADDADYLQLPATGQYDSNILKIPKIKNTTFSLNTGMVIIADNNKNYSFNTYFSAFYRISINRRLHVRAGNIFFFPVNSYYSHSESSEKPGITTYSGMMLFAAADYSATDRLTITGTVYKTIHKPFSTLENVPQVINRSSYNMPSQSFSLGMNYKIINGLSIGAEIRFSDSYQPLLSPYNHFPVFYQPGYVNW